MNPIYEKLFDCYAEPPLRRSNTDLSRLLASLPLENSARLTLMDEVNTLGLQWSTDAFTVGLHLGLSLANNYIRRGRSQQSD